jgi:hypothetical protein
MCIVKVTLVILYRGPQLAHISHHHVGDMHEKYSVQH